MSARFYVFVKQDRPASGSAHTLLSEESADGYDTCEAAEAAAEGQVKRGWSYKIEKWTTK